MLILSRSRSSFAARAVPARGGLELRVGLLQRLGEPAGLRGRFAGAPRFGLGLRQRLGERLVGDLQLGPAAPHLLVGELARGLLGSDRVDLPARLRLGRDGAIGLVLRAVGLADGRFCACLISTIATAPTATTTRRRPIVAEMTPRRTRADRFASASPASTKSISRRASSPR